MDVGSSGVNLHMHRSTNNVEEYLFEVYKIFKLRIREWKLFSGAGRLKISGDSCLRKIDVLPVHVLNDCTVHSRYREQVSFFVCLFTTMK